MKTWLFQLYADLGRRFDERGWVIWFLIVERGIRGLVVAGAGLLVLVVVRGGFADGVTDFQQRFFPEPGGGLVRRVIVDALGRIAGLSPHSVRVIAIGAVLYGGLELGESAGLLLRRRWAEYLVVIATGFGIPFEVMAVVNHALRHLQHDSGGFVLRAALLLINIAVVIYLVWRKRLFQFQPEMVL